jgi:hypothetical protein
MLYVLPSGHTLFSLERYIFDFGVTKLLGRLAHSAYCTDLIKPPLQCTLEFPSSYT